MKLSCLPIISSIILSFNIYAEGLNFNLASLNGGKVELNSLFEKYEAVAFVFLSPECPLSQNYTKQINEINEKFRNNKVLILPVISGKDFSKKQIHAFKDKYNLNSDILLDKNYKLASELNAGVTPEVFLIHSGDKSVVYSGAIDNWAISLGKQRKEITETYLINAIDSTLQGNEVKHSRTKPIGCFLEIK